jgi:hypothetical protein
MAFLANGTAIRRLWDARRTLQARAAAASAAASAAAPAPMDPAASPAATPNSPGAPAVSAINSPVPAPRKSTLPGALVMLFCIQSFGSGLQSEAQPLLATGHPAALFNDVADTFPIPPHNSNSLFYLQRTPNVNTIICELNEKDGSVDKDEPVHVLWIRYTEQQQRQELSFIQRHFAYGLKTKDLGNDVYELHFVSYKKVPLYLMKSPVDHQHHVYATITGRQAILSRVYIQINPGGTFWSPNVEYLELKGIDIQNGKELIQRIKV